MTKRLYADYGESHKKNESRDVTTSTWDSEQMDDYLAIVGGCTKKCIDLWRKVKSITSAKTRGIFFIFFQRISFIPPLKETASRESLVN